MKVDTVNLVKHFNLIYFLPSFNALYWKGTRFRAFDRVQFRKKTDVKAKRSAFIVIKGYKAEGWMEYNSQRKATFL